MFFHFCKTPVITQYFVQTPVFNEDKKFARCPEDPVYQREKLKNQVTMLYHSRTLAVEIRYPWEKRKITALTQTLLATQVQRDYNRIIREIGTPASLTKHMG